MAEKETGRVEAFSDGVFAIAITLLVLEIKVPKLPHTVSSEALASALLDLWPSYLAFLLSFFAILIMWINHHGLFNLVRRVNHSFLYANGFLLLLVSFVPFPTSVLAEYLDGRALNTAAAFYCGTFIFISIGFIAFSLVSIPTPSLHWESCQHCQRVMSARVRASSGQRLFGFLPARKAARLDPVIALASE